MHDFSSNQNPGCADGATPPPRCGEPGSRRWKDAPLAQELFILHNLMMRVGDRLVADLGLTGSRWLLMGALDRYDQPPTLSELSQDGLLSIQNVSRMVAAMEDDGLVERFTRPGAGRRVYVRLTAHGEAVKAAAHVRGQMFAQAFLAGMSGEQTQQTQDAVDRLTANLEIFESELATGRAVPPASGITAAGRARRTVGDAEDAA